MKHALKAIKAIGHGGTQRAFLKPIFRFTRTIRVFMALARASEARVDNRFYEVGWLKPFKYRVCLTAAFERMHGLEM